MSLKTQALKVRITPEEGSAFKNLAESMGESRACLLRKMIREAINQSPDFLSNELILFKLAVRQLVGIAHNFNQLMRAIHSGCAPLSSDTVPIEEIRKQVLQVKKELETYVYQTKNRWVKLPDENR